MNEDGTKISRAAFLGSLGGMAVATAFWKFSSVTSYLTTGSWQTAAVGGAGNSYGNSVYGGGGR